jgi:hypothetical protein
MRFMLELKEDILKEHLLLFALSPTLQSRYAVNKGLIKRGSIIDN